MKLREKEVDRKEGNLNVIRLEVHLKTPKGKEASLSSL